MNESIFMSKLKASCDLELKRNYLNEEVEYHLDIALRNLLSEVEVERRDVLCYISVVTHFHEHKAFVIVVYFIIGCDYIDMSGHIDPLFNCVFRLHIFQHKFLIFSQLFITHDKSSLT